MSAPTSLASVAAAKVVRVPTEGLGALFIRFLRFGFLAWGGPIAQIAMLRRTFVEEERWVTSEHFNRALALYQVLPGPEAHELCVYFGMLARGRIGGLLAGLGFMLPGFVLMFALSWAYVSIGLDLRGDFAVLFASVQAAVIALIVRAVHRIGSHVLVDPWLWGIAATVTAAQLMGVNFAILLLAGGLSYVIAGRSPLTALFCIFLGSIATIVWFTARPPTHGISEESSGIAMGTASIAALFWSGLKAGSLTFGGAYTVIPFLQRDAVWQRQWMTNEHFMDGIALAGLLPAPLVIFATFVGYLAGGPLGAIAMTAGVFLPAFALTLIAHEPLDRLVHAPNVKTFLDGVTASVVGIIAATTLSLIFTSVRSGIAIGVLIAAIAALFRWNHRLMVPLIVAGAIVFGGIAAVLSRLL